MLKDYPAAHSMDTQYFMIDECGHVVACFSNESGAIPHGAITEVQSVSEGDDEEAYWFEDERSAIANIAPSHIGSLIKQFKGKHIEPKYAFFGQIFFLSEIPEEYKKPLEENGDPIKRALVRIIDKCPGYGKKVVLLARFDNLDGFHEKIHEAGICLTCTSAFNVRGVRVGEKREYIPFYDHPSANCNAYPYMLQFVPSDLKKIDELSISEEEKKELKEGPAMKGCFLKKPFWQPTDEFKHCELYGEDYTALSVKSDQFKGLLKSVFGYW
jgi:hypothetical protein